MKELGYTFKISILVLNFFAVFGLFSCVSINKMGVTRVVPVPIQSADLPTEFDGLRVAFIADIHLQGALNRTGLALTVDNVNALKPDLILLGGDYVNSSKQIDPVFEELKRLTAPLGVFAVMGNHDEYSGRNETIKAMAKAHITLLDNSGVWLTRGKSRIRVAGVADLWYGRPDKEPGEKQVDAHDFMILMSHNPDYVEGLDLRLEDLVLSGHTHGGQITLFGLALVTASIYGRKYVYGLKDLPSGGKLYITRGLGTSGRINFRLFAPAEIALITLKSQ